MKQLKHIALLAGALVLATAGMAAQAALAIIAHPSNNAAGITLEEAEQIYLGKSRELANGRRVAPVDQASGTASRTKFYKSVIKKDERELKSYWSKLIFTGKGQPPREVGDDAAVQAWVASNPDAIGYVDGKFVNSSVKVLLIVP
jgi:ABC-type phosphate transport system substrate-binding protein